MQKVCILHLARFHTGKKDLENLPTVLVVEVSDLLPRDVMWMTLKAKVMNKVLSISISSSDVASEVNTA